MFRTRLHGARLTDDARSQDGRVLEELVRHNRVLGVLSIPEAEDGEEDETDDEHGDHAGVAPSAISELGQSEWQEDEGQRGGDEEQSDEVHLAGNVSEGGSNGSSGQFTLSSDLGLVQLLGLDLSPEHDTDDRGQTGGDLEKEVRS